MGNTCLLRMFDPFPGFNTIDLKTSVLCAILLVCQNLDSFGSVLPEIWYFNSESDYQYPDHQDSDRFSSVHVVSGGSPIISVSGTYEMVTASAGSTAACNAVGSAINILHAEPEPNSAKVISASGTCSPGNILNVDTLACTGSVMELNSQKALSYKWTPANQFNESTIQNPYVIIDSTRTYYLETMDYENNLVANPDFELGNTGFFSTYTYCDGINCLRPLGDNGYAVGTDANYFQSVFTGKDHTSGSGNFLIINGARPSLVVWQQMLPVKPFTDYAFGVWISTMISLSPAQIQFSINDGQVGLLYNAPVYADKWEQVFVTWNSGSATTATIKVVDILDVLEGNDFGLDDFFFGEITTCFDSITVHASENVKLGNDTIISPGEKISLTPANGPYNQYNWSTGESAQMITVAEAGTYWLSATDQRGCKSTDTINIMSSAYLVVFPNAFTPNADGVNDVFRPSASNVSDFRMSVFNRWGQFLYETTEVAAGWDGMVQGKDCPADMYIFIASYKLQDAEGVKTSRGSFRLIR